MFFAHITWSKKLACLTPHIRTHQAMENSAYKHTFFNFKKNNSFPFSKSVFFILLVSSLFLPFPLRLFITADSRWRGGKILGAKHRYVKVKTFMSSYIGEHNLLEKEAFSSSPLTEGRRQIKLEFTKNAFLARPFLTHSLLLFFSKIIFLFLFP